jgi:predicted RNA-binding protein YlxR (DUF448 family)
MTDRNVPLRMCVGCQRMKNRDELVRIVKNAQSEAVPDTAGKMRGRGAYVCKNAECVEKARKARRLNKALGIAAGDGIYTELAKIIADMESRG